MFAVVAHPIERAPRSESGLAEVERLAETNVLGERSPRSARRRLGNAHDLQHFGDLVGRRPDVATIREVVGFVCVGAHLVLIGHHTISH